MIYSKYEALCMQFTLLSHKPVNNLVCSVVGNAWMHKCINAWVNRSQFVLLGNRLHERAWMHWMHYYCLQKPSLNINLFKIPACSLPFKAVCNKAYKTINLKSFAKSVCAWELTLSSVYAAGCPNSPHLKTILSVEYDPCLVSTCTG